MRFAFAAVTMAVAFAVAPVAQAHEEIVVTGQVLSVAPSLLSLQPRTGKPVDIAITPDVRVYRGKDRVAVGEVLVGATVTVTGIGHSPDDMFVSSITIETPPKR